MLDNIKNYKISASAINKGLAPRLFFPFIILYTPILVIEVLTFFIPFFFLGFAWLYSDIHSISFVCHRDFKFKTFYTPKLGFINIFLTSLIKRIIITVFSFFLIIPGVIKFLNYSLVGFVAYDNPNVKSPTKLLKMSACLIKGKRWELFVLYLSFFSTIALSIVSFGLFFIWSIPYMKTTKANFYLKLYEEKIGKRFN